ncbi:MAG: hypothetical protein JNM20_06300 [Rhizobiales bacterium]|nr:hypothetical protein [Hyphomicrobiales bacterium]
MHRDPQSAIVRAGNPGTSMASYKLDPERLKNEARSGLRERLQREEMGDEAYERMIANNGEGTFRTFGIVFIIAFAAIVFGVAWLGW